MHHLYPNMPIYRNWQAWQLGKDVFERQPLVNIGINAKHYESISQHNEEALSLTPFFMQATIDEVEIVADGINRYVFSPADKDDNFPEFKAGAHIDVVVEPGLIRQYSLCNSPEQQNRYAIAVQCEMDGRGGSKTLHDNFKVGRKVLISRPRNLFTLKPASEVMLFAGGIGITPMLAMAWTLHQKGIPFQLHYCTATQSKWAFKETWQELPFLASTSVYVGDSPADKFDAKSVLNNHKQADIYVCGPAGFMDYIERTAMEADFSAEQFNKESFKAGGKLGEADNKPFVVKLTNSDKQFTVPPNKSIIQVLKENKIFIPVSCENGVCGTCKCKVTAGEVEHRDMVLSESEKRDEKLFTPCVSRAAGDSIEIKY